MILKLWDRKLINNLVELIIRLTKLFKRFLIQK